MCAPRERPEDIHGSVQAAFFVFLNIRPQMHTTGLIIASVEPWVIVMTHSYNWSTSIYLVNWLLLKEEAIMTLTKTYTQLHGIPTSHPYASSTHTPDSYNCSFLLGSLPKHPPRLLTMSSEPSPKPTPSHRFPYSSFGRDLTLTVPCS